MTQSFLNISLYSWKLIYVLGYDSMLHYFFSSNYFNFGRYWEQTEADSCVLVTHSHQCGALLSVLSTSSFSSLQDAPVSFCILSASALESATFPRSSGSLYWKMELETMA